MIENHNSWYLYPNMRAKYVHGRSEHNHLHISSSIKPTSTYPSIITPTRECRLSRERSCLLVDAGAVAGDRVLGWATREWLSTLLEDCTISSIHVLEKGGSRDLPIKCWLLMGYPWFCAR